MDYLVRTPAQLGQVLKGLRRERGMSQAQVAAQMGILQSKISALEADPKTISVERLFHLLAVLGVEPVLRPRGASTQRRASKAPLW